MYKVIIDNEEITVTQNDLDQLDATPTKSGHHILENNKAYLASTPKVGYNPKTGSLHINNKRFRFEILDQYDQLVNSMGLDAIVESKVKDIVAPMPGLILDIMVSAGDEIKKDQSILILEAMKMENVIKAEGDGIIKSVNHTVGQTVDKGSIIIEIE